jgi:ABC-type transport system involved in cytochrome c biogenesis permease component
VLWLGIFFAGMTAIDRSLASERGGCWDAEAVPRYPGQDCWAKLFVNGMAWLRCLLIPCSSVWSQGDPLEMLLIALLGNVGIVTVGTLISALATGLGGGSLPAGDFAVGHSGMLAAAGAAA